MLGGTWPSWQANGKGCSGDGGTRLFKPGAAFEGFRDVIAGYPGIEITSVNYNHYDGLTFMNQYFSLSDEADILVCLEGTGGQTLSHALPGAGYGVPFCGWL